MTAQWLDRDRLIRFIESPRVQAAIVVLILINAVTLGMETSDRLMAVAGPFIGWIDRAILAVFVVELAIKLFALRGRFFASAWNTFDLFVVSIALLPASGPLAVLRVLRILRLLSMVARFRVVVEALLRAIPGIISIAGLLSILFYVAAVIATGLFGARFPEWFGSLGASMYSLFQVMTLESWSMGIARPVMEVYPWAWAFFVPFILIATFTMLNLFIAIIVSAMPAMAAAATPADETAGTASVSAQIPELLNTVRALQDQVQQLNRQLSGSCPADGGTPPVVQTATERT